MTNYEHGNGPGGRVASARADADAAKRRLEQASRSRLEELMRLSPQARLAHINDIDLIATDRANLRRSVQAQLPIKRLRWQWRRSWLARRSWFDGLSQAAFANVIACGGLLILFVAAGWWTTATPYILHESEEMNFLMPEGWHSHLKVPANTKLGTLHRHGALRARLWFDGRGYAWTELRVSNAAQ